MTTDIIGNHSSRADLAGVLILVDLPQPGSYSAVGYRVLWTLCGVGIGLLVVLLAGLLGRGTARTPPKPPAQPA
jgi:hypothetical protein